jgi:hypothetical protein
VAARKGVESLGLDGMDGMAYFPCTDIVREIETGPDFSMIRAPSPSFVMENVPPCLGLGKSAWPAWPFLSPAWFSGEKFPDPLLFAATFLEELNRVKSLECAGCAADAACRGMHVNYVRKFGFKVLEPLPGRGRRR